MATINLSEMDAITFDGVALDKVIYNGTTVWENWKPITTELQVVGARYTYDYAQLIQTGSALGYGVRVVSFRFQADGTGSAWGAQENCYIEGLNANTNIWDRLYTGKCTVNQSNQYVTLTEELQNNTYNQFRVIINNGTGVQYYRYVRGMWLTSYKVKG